MTIVKYTPYGEFTELGRHTDFSYPVNYISSPQGGKFRSYNHPVETTNRQYDRLYVRRRPRKRYTEKVIRYIFGRFYRFNPEWKTERIMLCHDPKAIYLGDGETILNWDFNGPVYGDYDDHKKQPWYPTVLSYTFIYEARRERKMVNRRSCRMLLRRIGYDLD